MSHLRTRQRLNGTRICPVSGPLVFHLSLPIPSHSHTSDQEKDRRQRKFGARVTVRDSGNLVLAELAKTAHSGNYAPIWRENASGHFQSAGLAGEPGPCRADILPESACNLETRWLCYTRIRSQKSRKNSCKSAFPGWLRHNRCNVRCIHMAESADNDESPELPEARPRGRPKGLPKTGGRRKGADSAVGKAGREWLAQNSKALDVLARVASGKPVKIAGPTGKPHWHYPTWDDQRWAVEQILPRLVPTLSAAELSGPDGEPIQTEQFMADIRAQGLDPDREMARRIALVLSRGADAADSPEPKCGPLVSTSAERPAVPPGAEMRTTGQPGKPAESKSEPAELQPPTAPGRYVEIIKTPDGKEPGELVFPQMLKIACCAPCRPGLPVMYTLHRDGALVKQGRWQDCVATAEKLYGGPLPAVEDRAPAPPAPVSVFNHKTPDPIIHRGHDAKRRRS